MAFSMNGGSISGRGRSRSMPSMSEINIVPLVDVVMVLLVIFMLTAHVMEFGMELDVPKVRQVKETAQELPVVSVTKDGTLYLNDQAVNINELGDRIQKKFGGAKSAYLRGDKEAIWDVMAQVISALDEAKIHVNVVTQPEDEADRAKKTR
ncbi:MAG: biopolymer transporter ExbD [Acidobacteria bacterium]|nr:biopolymer transporter ExbD [Acidobacteriota bacterium]